ncbi:MAG TPA: hypothetical protein VKE96_10430 [Vicinamibacterales bacterium]|nr:hypothetical protein [Vicinamibacterales bacterium]
MAISVVRRIVPPALAAIALVASVSLTAVDAVQETAPPKPQPRKGVVVRGCLTGSKLTHIDPQTQLPADLELKLPDTLTVASIRVIRDQVKALNGHQVEVTGALRGIPGMETGILVADSNNAKIYLGGGDPKLGSDLSVARYEPPTIDAQMIKDVAAACDSIPPKP